VLLNGEPIVNAHRCCLVHAGAVEQNKAGEQITEGDPHPPSFLRRSLDFTVKVIPVAILAVLPKCPACLAAYVALGTGIGLSLTAATYLRMSLIVACVASLILFVVKMIRPKLRLSLMPDFPVWQFGLWRRRSAPRRRSSWPNWTR
jgi:hypothetical protein